MEKKNARDGIALIMPLMLGCGIFFAYPFLLVIKNSFYRGLGSTSTFAGMRNYQELLSNTLFRSAFANTAKFLLLSIPLILVLSLAIALVLKAYTDKFRFFKSILLLPYIMPVAGSVLIVSLLFDEAGVMSLLFPSDHGAFLSVVLLYLWKNAGYSVLILLSGLATIPDELFEAGKLDGASQWQILRYITMPQMWYSVFLAGVFSLVNAFKCFREIFLIGGKHPNLGIYMMQHFINNAFENMNIRKLSTAAVLLLLLLTVIFSACYAFVLRKEAYKE